MHSKIQKRFLKNLNKPVLFNDFLYKFGLFLATRLNRFCCNKYSSEGRAVDNSKRLKFINFSFVATAVETLGPWETDEILQERYNSPR